jgi:hypothetical protein
MKPLSLIIAFTPLIVFSLLSRVLPHGYIGVAGLVAKINRVLSAGWGAAIFAAGVSRVVAASVDGHTTRRLPDILLGLVIPVAIIIYMLKFSKRYPDKVTHQPAADAPAVR